MIMWNYSLPHNNDYVVCHAAYRELCGVAIFLLKNAFFRRNYSTVIGVVCRNERANLRRKKQKTFR